MQMFKYILAALLVTSLMVAANPVAANNDEVQHEEFNVIDYVFEHVNDSYEWHFFSINETHITLPLPVILYSKHTGWHFFLSNKFHQHNPDFPFKLGEEGKNKDKIVESLSDGTKYVPLDLSLTRSTVGVILSALILILITLRTAKLASRHVYEKPSGLQNFMEPIIIFIRDDIAKPFVGDAYKRYLPFLLTLFNFILIANLLGLILPLGLNITGNIAVTLTLALFTFLITIFTGNKYYWKHILNPESPWFMKSPLLPLMQFIEIIGALLKPLVLMIRLFANIFSGHMIIAVLVGLIFLLTAKFGLTAGIGTSVISVFFSVFIVFLDILVSFIQAYIFAVLSAMYFGMASVKKH